MTPLEKLQKQIDKCNHKNGCDSKCNANIQRTCPLLLGHAARINECRIKELPMKYW